MCKTIPNEAGRPGLRSAVDHQLQALPWWLERCYCEYFPLLSVLFLQLCSSSDGASPAHCVSSMCQERTKGYGGVWWVKPGRSVCEPPAAAGFFMQTKSLSVNIPPSVGDTQTCDFSSTDRRQEHICPTPLGQCQVCWLDTFLFMSTALCERCCCWRKVNNAEASRPCSL